MKSIYVVFEEEEFKMLKKAKKKLSWHDFVMLLTKRELKPKTDESAEPELEVGEAFLNYNEAREIIRRLDSEYDFKDKKGVEISKYAMALSEKRNNI
ncbi:unnamed protein product [marine sediment metagenome]|uniref:Uncharacterized protein n=1 Tax=marine sediment metagenome TaxID=412755 RepID=X1JSR4_9ZZZZ